MSNDNDIEKNVEAMSLLPDRYYIILRSNDEDEFTMSAYDTTNKTYESDDDFDAAMIIQEGIMDILRMKSEEVYDRGVAAIQFRLLGEEMLEDEDITDPKIIKAIENNVVKVDFGKKQ